MQCTVLSLRHQVTIKIILMQCFLFSSQDCVSTTTTMTLCHCSSSALMCSFDERAESSFSGILSIPLLLLESYNQGRLNQWAHWTRTQAPGFFFFLRGPQLAVVK